MADQEQYTGLDAFLRNQLNKPLRVGTIAHGDPLLGTLVQMNQPDTITIDHGNGQQTVIRKAAIAFVTELSG